MTVTDQIIAIITETTCGEACWHAREEICRCSCGGKNHGCLKTADGVRPDRTAKIQGNRYKLIAVGDQGELHHQAVALNEAGGITFLYADSSTDWMFAEIPAKLRRATESQFNSWVELAAERDSYNEARAKGSCLAEYSHQWPYLLWQRID